MKVEDAALHVVLVHPEIPWNTGNVGRSCLAAGAQLHLVEPLGFSLEDRYVRRAGLDYWPRVRPVIWPSWAAFEAALPQLGEPFLFSSDGQRPYWQVAYPPRSVLIFGGESAGLPGDLRAAYPGRSVVIPMEPASVRSLNLSNSVALGLFEVRRQRAQLPSGRPVQGPSS